LNGIRRIVIPGIPHHIVQRGNRRQQVFYCDEDRIYYLGLLKKYGAMFGLIFWFFVLMKNHLHLIAVPRYENSLSEVMARVNWKYALRINLREDWKGHLWQDRFYSCPLDHPHLIASARYIERNPVRAKIVERAEDYPWSSARSHVEKLPDFLVEECPLLEEISDWRSFVNEEEPEEDLKNIRKHLTTGRPLGDDAFIARLEQLTGRVLKTRNPGRPKKEIPESQAPLLIVGNGE